MDANAWDARYEEASLVWSPSANVWVEEVVSGLGPGTALDVAAGEGRNAFWLVERGWRVHATDFSTTAVRRMESLADERLAPSARPHLTTAVADAVQDAPAAAAYSLVLVSYLHLPAPDLRRALAHAVEALEPGGALVVVGHARRNVEEGVGGPQDPAVLYGPDDLVAALDGLPVRVVSADERERAVEGHERPALDTVVVAERLPGDGPGRD